MGKMLTKQEWDKYKDRRDVEIDKFKATFDIRAYFENEPRIGKPVSRGSDYSTFRCPVHGGASLVAYADSWKCFGACNAGGDIFQWLQWFSNIEFTEALRQFGVLDNLRKEFGLDDETPQTQTTKRYVRKPLAPVHEPKLEIAMPPSEEWQSRALQIVDRAQEVLWSSAGAEALDYLKKRGILIASIRKARLGFVPGVEGGFTAWNGLTIPHGITIPWIAEGHLWGVKVRRFGVEDNKYMPVSTVKKYVDEIGKGHHTKCLYGVDDILPHWPVLLTEGEFDRIVVWQEAPDLVCPVTCGAAGYRINPRWYVQLACASPLLDCFDNDDAGNKARESLKELTSRSISIRPPMGKDINEFHLQAGSMGVFRWLESVLEAA